MGALGRRPVTVCPRCVLRGGAVEQLFGEDVIPLTTSAVVALPPGDPRSRVDDLIAAEAAAPFNLTTGPVVRTTLLRLARHEHILLFTTHHIVSDAWSAAILFREMGELYDAFSNGRPSPLPPLPLQYADFAVWQRRCLRGGVPEAHLSPWKGPRAGARAAALERPADCGPRATPPHCEALAATRRDRPLPEPHRRRRRRSRHP